MAKTTISIEQKMARLEVYKDVLEHIETQIDWKQKQADEYLECAKQHTDEETGEINKNTYDYKQYVENARLVEAFKQLQEDLLAEA
jgi:CHASE3 domain sensor protein